MGGNGDFTAFVVVDGEGSVAAMTITSAGQVPMKTHKVVLKVELEGMKFRGGHFPFAEVKPALPDIF